MISRLLTPALQRAAKSILLLGPRQTGKSTMVRSLNPELEINLTDEQTFREHLSDPALIRKVSQGRSTVFVDEVQRLPSLLNTIQGILDSSKRIRFWLTGSSARKLKRGQANLLPGRILMYELGPLTLTELGDRFDLGRALETGLLPGMYLDPDGESVRKLLRTYAATYLREEIQAEALTKNLEGFSRFFQIVASRSGDAIDFTKFGSEAMIDRMSARRYFDILVDTLVVFPVDAFSRSARRRIVQHPKYYFFDVGVLNGALSNFTASEDRKGLLLEHLFLQLVLSEAKGRDEEIRVSSYRTEGGSEVDFIVECKRSTFAVEIKSSRTVRDHDLRGLQSFAGFFGKRHRAILAYLGGARQERGGISVLPLESAIAEIFSEERGVQGVR